MTSSPWQRLCFLVWHKHGQGLDIESGIPLNQLGHGIPIIKVRKDNSESSIYSLDITTVYGEINSSSSWQFISLLFSQHKKLDDRKKTTSEKGMQVTKRIDVKHSPIF